MIVVVDQPPDILDNGDLVDVLSAIVIFYSGQEFPAMKMTMSVMMMPIWKTEMMMISAISA
jgi:hypothetical protein